LGTDGDGAIDGKSAAPECFENFDAPVAQKVLVFEPMDDFVAEELLGSRGVVAARTIGAIHIYALRF
jgi:hypothetical protein